jgi:hypothetical protein
VSSSDFTKPEWQSEAGDDSEDAITRRLNRSYLAGATEAAEIALRDTAMVAGQHSNAAASAIGDMTVEQIVKLTNRGYTILNATLQSATERMACGHLKADTLEAKHGFSQEEMAEMGSTVSCLICAENHAHYLKGYEAGAISVDVKAATAAAMAQQRDVDAMLANLRIAVPRRGEGCEIAARQRDYIAREIRNAPLASAPAQEWLERHDIEQRNAARREQWEYIAAKMGEKYNKNFIFEDVLERRLAEQDEKWVDAMGWTDLVHTGPYTQDDRKQYVKLLVDSVTHNMVEEPELERQLAAARRAEARWWIEYGADRDGGISDMGRDRIAKLEAEAADQQC